MKFLNIKEIKPEGWLKRQLEIQSEGLSGHLDKIWPDIRDSKWIGGTCEGWERVPYWLDGFIPLAYLLDDEDKKARAKRYIDAIVSRQCEDGWICPCEESERTTYDVWALFLMLKVLVVYADCSQDESIEEVVYKALKNLYGFVKANTLRNWAAARWYECLISIAWLYERRPEPWLKELAKRIRAQGMDLDNVCTLWQDVSREWSFETHVVNAAMSLKGEALYSAFMGEERKGQAEKLYGILQKYHGTAFDHFNGDECFAGSSPIQGTELCGVAEAMYSYELLFAITENPFWCNLIESLAFNALPATISDDMWTHQYDQMSNQIACIGYPENPLFTTNGKDANRFGLEPFFGCCTSNFNQAWPKLARSVIGKSENGFTAITALPCTVESDWLGEKVKIECVTEYPFRNKIVYKIHSESKTPWTFKVSVPQRTVLKADGAEVKDGFLTKEIACGDETLVINVERTPVLLEREMGLSVLKYGSILFSVPLKERREMLEYEKDGVIRKFPYCDYDIYPAEDWGYAFKKNAKYEIVECDYSRAFDRKNPPLKIATKMCKIGWGEEDGHKYVAARVPKSTVCEQVKDVYLQPYGATTLRMTEMPVLDE